MKKILFAIKGYEYLAEKVMACGDFDIRDRNIVDYFKGSSVKCPATISEVAGAFIIVKSNSIIIRLLPAF